MDEKIFNWDDLRLFLALARAGSLSAAARDSGSSPATLSRRMLALERTTGSALFIRHDRGYTLTPDGAALHNQLAPIEDTILAATAPADPSETPLIRISSGTWTTRLLLANIADLTGSPPDLRLRFITSEAVLDMPHREVAIGIRNKRPTEPNLAGREVSRVHFAVFATATAPDAWIRVMTDTPSARWVRARTGDPVVCEVTAPRDALDLALNGTGKVVLPTFVGALHPTLVQTGDIIDELSHGQWVVTHQDDRHLPEVRRLLDRLYRVIKPVS